MPVRQSSYGDSRKGGKEPDVDLMGTPLMWRIISGLIPTAAQQIEYGSYARARYGDQGLGDMGYTSLEMNALAIFRPEPSGKILVGPLTLAPITLAQGTGTSLHIHGRSATSMQRTLHRRVDDWKKFDLPGKLSFHIRDDPLEVLDERPFDKTLVDEMTIRVPDANWGRPYMEKLAKKMLSRLNIDGTKHPRGANVLLGLTEQRVYPETVTDPPRFVDVFSEKAEAQGLELDVAGIYNIAGKGNPAKVIFLKRP